MVGMKHLVPFFLAVFALAQPSGGQQQVNLAKTLPAPAATVMHADTLALSTVAAGATTASMTLAAVPIGAMGALVHYISGLVGGDIFVPALSIQQALVFTLPSYWASGDTIQVVYWSTK